MAFLDNSGDIILDAVLTDTGRKRLAKGDGSFRIAKFCLGDDEINYGSYDKNHASGSAYYDLDILQTPVLEAFTNNTSLMNSKLISIPRTSLMYLPEIVLNTLRASSKMHTTAPSQNTFLVAVDVDTEKALSRAVVDGVINGFSVSKDTDHWVRLDQGLNTTEISANERLDGDLIETQYIIEIDNRFGSIWDRNGKTSAKVSFIDDDNIASYYLSYNTDKPTFIRDLSPPNQDGTELPQVIAGPRGTRLRFTIKASIELSTNNYLFDKLGASGLTITGTSAAAGTYRYLDSVVRVTGATTGYRVDVPLRFVKQV